MSGLWQTSRNAFAEVAAKPRALGVQMLIMAINDFVWVVFWVLFFDQVGSLGGWVRDTIIVLQAVLTTAGGLSLGFFANRAPHRIDGRRRRSRGDPHAPGVATAVRAGSAASSR